MTKDEALKLALKFVEDTECGTADLEAHIKEALAQRTWVGLTDKEIKLLANPPDEAKIIMTGRMWIFVGDLMDKLKEKNHASP